LLRLLLVGREYKHEKEGVIVFRGDEAVQVLMVVRMMRDRATRSVLSWAGRTWAQAMPWFSSFSEAGVLSWG
jgi:hypothetical protein